MDAWYSQKFGDRFVLFFFSEKPSNAYRPESEIPWGTLLDKESPI